LVEVEGLVALDRELNPLRWRLVTLSRVVRDGGCAGLRIFGECSKRLLVVSPDTYKKDLWHPKRLPFRVLGVCLDSRYGGDNVLKFKNC